MPRRAPVPELPAAGIARWGQLWGLPGLGERVTVTFSSRLRRSFGRCVPARAVVRLNPHVLRRHPELLEETLCHELAHVAAFELHGRHCRPHGPEWAVLMRAAGFEARVRARLRDDVSIPPPRHAAPRALYVHRCPLCAAARGARRPVPQWRCAHCRAAGLDGALTITKYTRLPA